MVANRLLGNSKGRWLHCCLTWGLSDPALYVSKIGRCFIFLWVDDLLILSAKNQLQPLVEKILTPIKGRDQEKLSCVLGMEVIQDRSKQRITNKHRKVITDLLSRFNMSDCKRSPTPLVPKEKIMSLPKYSTLERATESEHKRFMPAVKSIRYIAVVTWPALAFAAHLLARCMAGSAKKHWLAVQHVMRCL